MVEQKVLNLKDLISEIKVSFILKKDLTDRFPDYKQTEAFQFEESNDFEEKKTKHHPKRIKRSSSEGSSDENSRGKDEEQMRKLSKKEKSTFKHTR
jgi:hypothetical protein